MKEHLIIKTDPATNAVEVQILNPVTGQWESETFTAKNLTVALEDALRFARSWNRFCGKCNEFVADSDCEESYCNAGVCTDCWEYLNG